jgi:hypothetical protein
MKNCGLLLKLLMLVPIIPSVTSEVRADESKEYDLKLAVRCPLKNISRGDEIPIIFTITNNGPSPYSYEKRNYDRSGRMSEYALRAWDENGTIVSDPRQDHREGIGGGLSGGTGSLRTGQSFSRTIALNRWALINKSGRYKVVGTYTYHVEDPDASRRRGIRMLKAVQVKSAPIEIAVNPRGQRLMGRYIKRLSRELKAIEPSKQWEIVEQRQAIVTKLAYTCDNRIIPILIDLMYKNHHGNEVFWAREAFLCYLPRDPQIANAILKEANKRGLAPGMQSVLEEFGCSEQQLREIIRISLDSDNLDILNAGVGAAQKHPDDKHMARLISIAMDPDRLRPDRPSPAIERDRAIYAIAVNRTDEGVQTLNALLKDPDKGIRRTTQDAIRQAYRRHPEYPKQPDDEYTAALVPIALDVDDPMHIPMIIGICRSRTEEGVNALKALLADPGQDIAIARTDAGVKAIRDLLRNPDEDIRKITADIVEGVYREYPGRPLRDDDFPEGFRETLEERKKRILERIASR